MFLPFQILLKMIIGLTKLPRAKPIEILLFLISLVVFYAGMATQNYNIGLISGLILGFQLFIRGGMKK
jgi:hypothetical protein